MSDDSEIGKRLRELMETAQVGENELARRANVPQPTIHRILKGVSKSPRASNLEKIASALGTTTAYLTYGDTHPHSVSAGAKLRAIGSLFGPIGISASFPIGYAMDALSGARQKPASPIYEYPLLDWTQTKTPDGVTAAVSSKKTALEPSNYRTKGIGFWLAVKGDAMSAPPGNSPSLPEATKVLFDTGASSTLGKLVLAQLSGNPIPTFRKLIEDNGQRYLQPLNPSYPLIRLGNDSLVLAVAIEAKTLL